MSADPDFLFWLGTTAVRAAGGARSSEERTAYLRVASKAFQRILVIDPASVRPRLELARTFFLMGKDARAREHFRKALASDLPPMVRHNVEFHLALMQRRKRWFATLGAALAPKDVRITVSVPTSHTQIFNYYLCFGGDATLDENGVYLAGEDYRVVAPGGAGVKIIWTTILTVRCATSAIGSGGGTEDWQVRVYGDTASEAHEEVKVYLRADGSEFVTNSPRTIVIENDDLAANRLWLSKTSSEEEEPDFQYEDVSFSVQADAGETVHYVLCLSGTATRRAQPTTAGDWILLAEGAAVRRSGLSSDVCPGSRLGYKGSLTASDRKDDFSVRVSARTLSDGAVIGLFEGDRLPVAARPGGGAARPSTRQAASRLLRCATALRVTRRRPRDTVLPWP